MIKVIHKKNSDKHKNVIYVGRGSILGNPYTSIQHKKTLANFVVNSREESISMFRNYLLEQINNKNQEICQILNHIYILAKNEDVFLSCYCKPKSCHADIIKEIVDSKFLNLEYIQKEMNF